MRSRPVPTSATDNITKNELDRAVRAALADSPTDDERAAAAALVDALRAAVVADPVRLAAAAFGPPPASLGFKDQVENALHNDQELPWEMLGAIVWGQEWLRALNRIAEARATDTMTVHPEAWSATGILPPWNVFSPFERRRDLLTPTQAAERLGVTVSELRRLSDRGEIPTVRLKNGRRRYAPGALDAVRARGVEPTA